MGEIILTHLKSRQKKREKMFFIFIFAIFAQMQMC